MKKNKKNEPWVETVICDKCGYNNHKYWIEKSGKCNGCGKILNEKADFIHQMRKKLHIVKGKQWREF